MKFNERGITAVAGLVVVVLLVAVGAGAYLLLRGDEISSVPGSDEAGSRPSPSASAAESAQLSAGAEERWGIEYLRLEKSGAEERDVLQIYFVHENAVGPRAAFKAQKCANHYLKETIFFGVSCYGFDSLEALEYSSPDAETGAFRAVCWQGYVSKSKNGVVVKKIDSGGAAEAGCPGA